LAGHNKWSKIKHKKAKEDVKRGKIFTRLIREIEVAARSGGPDPQYNATLRAAMDVAKAENMPADTMERAARRGAGELPGQVIEEVFYEGYAPGGVAVLVRCLTDNRNRTAGAVRHAFSKGGGSLGENGSVQWMFERFGLVEIEAEADEETMMELAIEVGAGDLEATDRPGRWRLTCVDTDLGAVRARLETLGHTVTVAELSFAAKSDVAVSGKDAEAVIRLLHMLDELDDVQEVYANEEIPEDELERLAEAV
jgi:YebC/PmpR family DNA-binding regulatory protein